MYLRFNKKTIIKLIALLASAFFIFSCNDDKKTVIQVSNNEMMTLLLSELKKDNINYELLDGNKLYIDKTDYKNINILYHKIRNEVLPPKRHASFPEEIQHAIKSALNNNGYHYRIVCFDKIEWIVWDEEYANEINALINQEIISTIERLNSQAVTQNKSIDIGKDMTRCEN